MKKFVYLFLIAICAISCVENDTLTTINFPEFRAHTSDFVGITVSDICYCYEHEPYKDTKVDHIVFFSKDYYKGIDSSYVYACITYGYTAILHKYTIAEFEKNRNRICFEINDTINDRIERTNMRIKCAMSRIRLNVDDRDFLKYTDINMRTDNIYLNASIKK